MDNAQKLIKKAGKALQQGKYAEAKATLRKILKRHPAHGDANYLLGTVLAECGEFPLALDHLKRAQLALPNSPYVHNNLGNIYLKTSRAQLAATHYETALRLQSQLPQAHFNLASIYKMQGQHDAALQHYNEAAKEPGFVTQANIGSASLLNEKGNYPQALAILTPMFDTHADNPMFLTIFSSICLHITHEPELQRKAREALHKMLDSASRRESIPEIERIPLYFRLAALEEKAGNYDIAFEYYSTGNQLKHREGDGINYQQQEQQLRQAYEGKVTHGDSDARPLFIVGMPRSGSTLVEQILDCHPQLHGLGECEALPSLLKDKPRPLPTEELAELSQAYLKATDSMQRRGIDKYLDNYLNIGAILQLFPQARIIYTRRNPVDTCLSCYFTDFFGKLDYSYDLTQLGKHHRHFERMMQWWQQHYPNAIHAIDYEELVEDTEAQVRQLLEFCGEEWDPACLSPHNNQRYAATASTHQVRKPVYKNSVGRAQHYRDHLQPLLDALDEEGSE